MLKTPLDVAKFLLVVHSDFEMLRSYRRISLTKYYHSELLYEISDLRGDRGYATKEVASILQAIKSARLDKNSRTVLSIFEKRIKLTLHELMEESPLGSERTQRALADLFDGNYIARYPGGYILVPRKYSREAAISKFIEALANAFGFINLKVVQEFTSDLISPGEIAETLGFIGMSRGIYLNDGTLYYAFEDELERVDEKDIPIVLEPKDPLARVLRVIFPQKIEGFLVVKGEFVGTVKVSGKRKIKVTKEYPEGAAEIFYEALELNPPGWK